MPIYIELANLIIPKSNVESKYSGGLYKFREDYNTQEDDHLISLSAMNVDELDIPFEVGDYVIATRYGGADSTPDWYRSNGIFVWHKDTRRELVEQANKIANTGVEKIFEAIENGVSPLVSF